MTHNDVYRHFEKLFPIYRDITDCWFENGMNSIRVRLTSRKELIFSFNKSDDWKLETVTRFLNEKKEGHNGKNKNKRKSV